MVFLFLGLGHPPCSVDARSSRQHGKMPVVGVLWHAGSAEEEDVYLVVLRKAFSDLGYVLAADVRCGS